MLAADALCYAADLAPVLGEVKRVLASFRQPLSEVERRDLQVAIRQLLETDMVYVRDFSQRENMSPEQWKHLALIAHHCYGSYDLALKAILTLIETGHVPEGANKRYLASLRKPN